VKIGQNVSDWHSKIRNSSIVDYPQMTRVFQPGKYFLQMSLSKISIFSYNQYQ